MFICLYLLKKLPHCFLIRLGEEVHKFCFTVCTVRIYVTQGMDYLEEGNWTTSTPVLYQEARSLGILFFRIPLGIVGNSFVLLAVALSKRLQTVANIFVINLAIADILTCSLLIGYYVSNWIEYFQGLDIFCIIIVALTQACVGCSIYTLASISVNRYVIITRSIRFYQLTFQPRVVAPWIISIWSVSIAVSIFPPLACGIGELGYDWDSSQCNPKSSHPKAMVYEIILTVFYFPVPLVVTIVCYTFVYLHLRLHNKRMKHHIYHDGLNMTSTSTSNDEDRPVTKVSRPSSGLKTISRRQIQITKNLFIIFCAFLLCMMPHAICSVIGCAGNVTRIIVSLHNVINPFIYGISHPLFREVFKCILTLRPIREPSTIGKLFNRITTL
ncbi:Rhodopsin, GQ-coupled [Holothuria leucospilota]|uniref:Rhodopsin, GQ-coupled n=1 Tax=Holothuria leucospilota TaxID=206669 RepID=A0A9Q1CBC0_HOLLE|nr:Rhodopsin, GQ-coupled [Holothuria leucospilota]